MKDIPGHEGRYAVNEDGTKLYSYPKPKEMMQGCTGWTKAKYLSIRKDKDGYWKTTLSIKDAKGRRPVIYGIHRLVAMAYIGLPSDPALQINHIDGNVDNNHFSNLEWVTLHENLADSWKNKNRSKPYKYSIDQILLARKMFKEGYKKSVISKKCKINKSSLDYIIKNKGVYKRTDQELKELMNSSK